MSGVGVEELGSLESPVSRSLDVRWQDFNVGFGSNEYKYK